MTPAAPRRRRARAAAEPRIAAAPREPGRVRLATRAPAAAAAALALVLAAGTALAVPAAADTNPPPAAGDPAPSAPVPLNTASPGLKLAKGATLAPAKVLDIVSVTDQGSVSASQPEQRDETSNSTVTYALQAEVLFGKDSSTLSPSASARIQAIARDINTRHVTSPIRVFGFTDNLGSSAHGDALSKARANAVYKVLARELTTLGDPGHTFQVRGYGEDYPIADNSTESSRRENRRVEITFTPPVS